jgi:hypothetical protein
VIVSNGNGSREVGPKTFEIGLVMAGAISAGAYTAGVVDFLLQALDEWEAAKETGTAPPHQVKLNVMAGASAGGMTAAITAAALCGDIAPVREPPRPGDEINNALYDSWVNRIDIEYLLRDDDLKASDSEVKSLLDSTVLGQIADSGLSVKPTGRRRNYLPDLLHVILTVTNLRGVPYNITFKGNTRAGHGMSSHADYLHFALSDNGSRKFAGAFSLDRDRDQRRTDLIDHWETLKGAALATGAFPVGLAPRVLARRLTRLNGTIEDDYSERKWPIPAPGMSDEKGQCRCEEALPLPPFWPENLPENYSYEFLCVDGGVMNNEPLELARRVLMGADGHNPREPEKAKRAVLMIDPFPNIAPFDLQYKVEDGLLKVITRLFGGLKNQARFKPEEIALALMEDIASRFMIAPSRDLPGDSPIEFAMASSSLGGFGGLLSRAFRDHDFQLGRRNCQQFLRVHFALPAETRPNPLFDDWKPDQKDQYGVRENGELYLPVIPLLGSAKEEVKPLPWPSYSERDFETLTGQVKARLDAVAQCLIREYFRNFALRLGAKLLWGGKRREVLDKIMGVIRQDLAMHKLMR